MSWSLDTKGQSTYGTSNPNTLAYTCAATSKLLVAVIFVTGTTARAGGSPTYNGITMTDSGSGFVVQASGEAGVEIWYLLNPGTGSSYSISVPNSGSLSLQISAMSFIPSAGGAAVDKYNSATGTTTPATVTVTAVAANALMVGGVGSGDRDAPTQGAAYTLGHTYDAGALVFGSEYDLDTGGAGNPVVDFTLARDDDWGIIGVSFVEALATPQVNKTEAVTAADAPTIDKLIVNASTTQAITAGDAPTMLLGVEISSNQEITVGDTPTVAVESLITPNEVSTGEAVAVTEGPRYYPDEIIVFEWATVDLVIEIGASETITVGDTPTVALVSAGEITVSVSETAITVADVPALGALGLEIGASQDVTIADAPTVSLPEVGAIAFSVSESISVGETATVDPLLLNTSASQDVTVTDEPTVSLPEAGVIALSTAESVTLSESVAIQAGESQISIYETITVTDTPTISLLEAGTMAINVSESVTVGESVTVSMGLLAVSKDENVTVSESYSVDLAMEISETETVTLSDSTTESVAVGVQVSDTITITETISGSIPGYYPDLHVSVTETISMDLFFLVAFYITGRATASDQVYALAIGQDELYTKSASLDELYMVATGGDSDNG